MTHPKSKLLSQDELSALLAKSPAPRVKPVDIDARIKSIDFFRLTETITVCQIALDNGFSVRGESACVCPENYDQAIGEHFAEKQAREKLWPVMGLLLAEEIFRSEGQPIAGQSSPAAESEASEQSDAAAAAEEDSETSQAA